ncbi:hypothetical protein JG687_00016134 [Phytophthora cactorum]|uniref:Uncharacterized protein n=1 Tax=Phytophthora cactorum TaxID=29920 RepID=A0A8T1TV69_9STRA|nr:hypothetical protein JG687_00016134 [Phytophthora cactorum]
MLPYSICLGQVQAHTEARSNGSTDREQRPVNVVTHAYRRGDGVCSLPPRDLARSPTLVVAEGAYSRMGKLWDRYGSRAISRTVKTDSVRSTEQPGTLNG